jgi:hypothetical protein
VEINNPNGNVGVVVLAFDELEIEGVRLPPGESAPNPLAPYIVVPVPDGVALLFEPGRALLEDLRRGKGDAGFRFREQLGADGFLVLRGEVE